MAGPALNGNPLPGVEEGITDITPAGLCGLLQMVICLPMSGGLALRRRLLRFSRWLSSFREIRGGKPAGFHDPGALVDILLDRALHPTLLQSQCVIEAPAL